MQPDESGSRSKSIKLGLAIAALIGAVMIAYFQVGGPDAADIAAERAYIDVETGKVFSYTIRTGDVEPVEAPSGKRTGYRAESCFWGKAADGRWFIKDKPTYVILKQRLDPNSTEETLCPECGRRVVGHNRKPRPEDIERANAGMESSETEAGAEQPD